MLKTLMNTTGTKGAFALAAALTFTGTLAHAESHEIDIDDGAYTPVISYIGSGDNLIFTNFSDQAHTLNGPDDSWTSGPIQPGGTYVLNISDEMALTFSGTAIDGEIMSGEFTYEPAPDA